MNRPQWAEVSAGRRGSRGTARVLILTDDQDEGGCFTTAHDRHGRETATTWHASFDHARTWADTEYGQSSVGSWQQVPLRADPVRHALRHRR